MSDGPYSQKVRELFADPAHGGRLADATVARVDAQGISVELSAETRDGRLAKVAFRARGCPHLIAAAEALCARVEGRDVAELGRFVAAELMKSLPVPVEKTGRILVLEDAVRELMAALRNESTSTD